jgi:hypothetical protein
VGKVEQLKIKLSLVEFYVYGSSEKQLIIVNIYSDILEVRENLTEDEVINMNQANKEIQTNQTDFTPSDVRAQCT